MPSQPGAGTCPTTTSVGSVASSSTALAQRANSLGMTVLCVGISFGTAWNIDANRNRIQCWESVAIPFTWWVAGPCPSPSSGNDGD